MPKPPKNQSPLRTQHCPGIIKHGPRKGQQCAHYAGWGTGHPGSGYCRKHGGATKTHEKANQRDMAAKQVITYGLPRNIDPIEALLEELYRTAGHVSWLQDLVGKLHADKITQTGGNMQQEAHIYIKMYQEERAHFTRIAKTCVDVGIEERRVRLAEQQGQLMATAIRAILTRLNVPLDSAETRQIVREELQTIDSTATLATKELEHAKAK